MRSLLIVATLLLHKGLACISSAPRQYSAPTATGYQYQQYGASQYSAPQYSGAQYSGVASGAGSRSAAAAGASNVEPLQPISGSRISDNLFGPRVTLSEFSSNGYNAEGGGPVAHGTALGCDFEGRPCCWANVPTPDDQIDWLMASGVPESQYFQNVTIDGKYLVAYASGAAPSDEAQFASCSIGCASSPIRVRARHWQSANVLLQVCQRESFPNSVNFNPLLNCQEFPMVQGLGQTELILPKASLVDIVFVASNFVNENGDIAVLDAIEILYESDPAECENTNNAAASQSIQKSTDVTGQQTGGQTVSRGAGAGSGQTPQGTGNTGDLESLTAVDGGEQGGQGGSARPGGANAGQGNGASGQGSGVSGQTSSASGQGSDASGQGTGASAIDGHAAGANGLEGISAAGGQGSGATSEIGGETSGLGENGSNSARAHGVNGVNAIDNGVNGNEQGSSSSSGSSAAASASASSSSSSSSSSLSSTSFKEESTVISSIRSCQLTKCTFEDGTTCSYKDTYENESIRGLTTRFQVVKGQFMNRVTGVREGIEGNYYAATFLYPREKAGLSADVGQLLEDRRLRFQYYEGTHGVQLKGCCDSVDVCPFSSDKFVTVSDRMWKFGSFACPQGTQKLIFLCENTRTNQGACALDDIQVVDNKETVTLEEKPLC